MICQSEDMMEQFEEKWKRFVGVILSYSRAIPFQTKELKQILEELGDDCDGKLDITCVHIFIHFLKVSTDNLTEVEHIAALKCVASFLVPKRKKQGSKDRYTVIPFLLINVPVSWIYCNHVGAHKI